MTSFLANGVNDPLYGWMRSPTRAGRSVSRACRMAVQQGPYCSGGRRTAGSYTELDKRQPSRKLGWNPFTD